MSSKKKKISIFLGKVALVTLLIVLFIRGFFFESFTISSSQMETSLNNGDKVFINKMAYGIRMPITLLSVPFTFDSLLLGRSYSTAIQLPYKRFFSQQVNVNDVVLFNNPTEMEKPLDKRGLLVSRCVALPGDTIEMKQGEFYVNGKIYIGSPNQMGEYTLGLVHKNIVTEMLPTLGIPHRNLRKSGDSLSITLSRYEVFILNESLPDSLRMNQKRSNIQDYKLIVPFKGRIIELDEHNVTVYNQIVRQEQNGRKVTVEYGYLLIDDTPQKEYTFSDDYYWVLSDNSENSSDSHSIGFVPYRNIIGRVGSIWKSNDKGLSFSSVE